MFMLGLDRRAASYTWTVLFIVLLVAGSISSKRPLPL